MSLSVIGQDLLLERVNIKGTYYDIRISRWKEGRIVIPFQPDELWLKEDINTVRQLAAKVFEASLPNNTVEYTTAEDGSLDMERIYHIFQGPRTGGMSILAGNPSDYFIAAKLKEEPVPSHPLSRPEKTLPNGITNKAESIFEGLTYQNLKEHAQNSSQHPELNNVYTQFLALLNNPNEDGELRKWFLKAHKESLSHYQSRQEAAECLVRFIESKEDPTQLERFLYTYDLSSI